VDVSLAEHVLLLVCSEKIRYIGGVPVLRIFASVVRGVGGAEGIAGVGNNFEVDYLVLITGGHLI